MGGKRIQDTYELTTKAETRGIDSANTAFEEFGREIKDTSKAARDSAADFEAGGSALDNFSSAGETAAGVFAGLALKDTFDGIKDSALDLGGQFLEMGDSMNQLAAQTGLTGAELDGIQQSALDLFAAGRGESLDELTNTLANVRNVTGLTGDELENTARKVTVLQETFDELDPTETTRAANQAMMAFGEDMDSMLDMIGFTMQEVGDPQGDLLDTINEYSTTFEQAGFSAQGMFETLISGNEAGIFSFDKTADAVREFGIRTREGSEEVRSAYDTLFREVEEGFQVMGPDGTQVVIDSYADMERAITDGSLNLAQIQDFVGESLLDLEDPLQRNALAAQLIGTQYEDLGPAILEAFDVAGDGIGDFEGSVDGMQAALDEGLGPAWDTFKRGVQVALFTALRPTIADITQKLTPALIRLGVWLGSEGIPMFAAFAGTIIKDVGRAFGLFIKAIKPIVEIFKNFIKDNPKLFVTFAKIAAVIATLIGVFGTLAAFLAPIFPIFAGIASVISTLIPLFIFLIGPVGLLIAAVVALGLAYTTNFMGIRDVVDRVINYVLGLLGQLLAWFVSEGIPVITAAIAAFVLVWSVIKSAVMDFWNSIKPTLESLYNWFVSEGIPFINAAIQGFIDFINMVRTVILGLWLFVKPTLDKIYNWFVSEGIPFINTAIQTYIDYINMVRTVILALWLFVKPTLDKIFNWFTSEGLPLVTEAVESLRQKFIAARTVIQTLWAFISPHLETLKTWFSENMPTVQDAVQLIVDKFNAVKETATSLWDNIRDKIDSFKTGISSAFGGALGPINDVLNALNSLANFDPSSIDLGPFSVGDILSVTGIGGQSGVQWSGSGPLNKPAGVFHKQESVIPAHGMQAASVNVIPTPSGLRANVGLPMSAAISAAPGVRGGGGGDFVIAGGRFNFYGVQDVAGLIREMEKMKRRQTDRFIRGSIG